MMDTQNSTLPQLALKLQAFLASDAGSARLLADLRRLDPTAPSLAALASVMQLMPHASAADCGRWLTVAKAFALASPKLHRDRRSLGSALWAAGVSELRFQRLLATPEAHRCEAVWRLCRLLRAKQEAFDFVDLAKLLLYRDEEILLRHQMTLAQAYLRAQRGGELESAPAVAH